MVQCLTLKHIDAQKGTRTTKVLIITQKLTTVRRVNRGLSVPTSGQSSCWVVTPCQSAQDLLGEATLEQPPKVIPHHSILQVKQAINCTPAMEITILDRTSIATLVIAMEVKAKPSTQVNTHRNPKMQWFVNQSFISPPAMTTSRAFNLITSTPRLHWRQTNSITSAVPNIMKGKRQIIVNITFTFLFVLTPRVKYFLRSGS